MSLETIISKTEAYTEAYAAKYNIVSMIVYFEIYRKYLNSLIERR